MSQPVCAIVGAGEGLGRALAAKFASQGFDIALISRSEANSAAAIEDATTTVVGANVQFFSADATQPETIEVALANIAEDMGEIDVLIYNARGEFTACEPLKMSYTAL
jgi:short-subunit dehydrogenase